MRATDTLALHALLADVVRTPAAGDYLASLGQESLGIPLSGGSTRFLATALRNHVEGAHTFRIAENMNEEIRQAAARLPETTRYGDIDPPTGCGVMVLNQPWPMSEVLGNDQSTNLITWGPIQVGQSADAVRGGYAFTFWRHIRRSPDAFVERIQADRLRAATTRAFGGLYPMVVAGAAKDMEIGSFERSMPPEKAAEIRARGDVPTDRPLYQPMHLILAAWKLMDETLTDVVDEPLQRASQRLARRSHIPARVQVVTLRRKASGDHTGMGRPLEWRVPVREHHQHYWVRDPETGEKVRVKRFIKADWRGPVDAPVRVTDKVYDLKR
jgi:hypothetical protein